VILFTILAFICWLIHILIILNEDYCIRIEINGMAGEFSVACTDCNSYIGHMPLWRKVWYKLDDGCLYHSACYHYGAVEGETKKCIRRSLNEK